MTDFNDMLQKAKKMQEKMKEAQEQIKRIEVEGVSGGSLVKVILTGDYEIKSIVISDEAKKAHASILRMNKKLRDSVRPGILPSDLYLLTMKMFEEEGYESLTPQAGHSLGRTVHEPPFLVKGSNKPLEPGMIVVVEPTMRVQGVGSINIEDTTLVTEDGCESLTSSPREWDAFL